MTVTLLYYYDLYRFWCVFLIVFFKQLSLQVRSIMLTSAVVVRPLMASRSMLMIKPRKWFSSTPSSPDKNDRDLSSFPVLLPRLRLNIQTLKFITYLPVFDFMSLNVQTVISHTNTQSHEIQLNIFTLTAALGQKKEMVGLGACWLWVFHLH